MGRIIKASDPALKTREGEKGNFGWPLVGRTGRGNHNKRREGKEKTQKPSQKKTIKGRKRAAQAQAIMYRGRPRSEGAGGRATVPSPSRKSRAGTRRRINRRGSKKNEETLRTAMKKYERFRVSARG